MWRGVGKKNEVVKLTDRKIGYIIRAKKRGDSTKRIAEDMKLSLFSVKRVWMHWTKTKMHLNIKKFGILLEKIRVPGSDNAVVMTSSPKK